jgi:hypothetical protein
MSDDKTNEEDIDMERIINYLEERREKLASINYKDPKKLQSQKSRLDDYDGALAVLKKFTSELVDTPADAE